MMEATRSRLSFNVDALATGAALVSVLLVGLLTAREFHDAPWALSNTSRHASSIATVPQEAVSVPALILGDAVAIRVGDRAASALGRLTGPVRFVNRIEERGPIGTREVRSYQRADTAFIVVLEPFERGAEPRVAAIYLR
jgi:hypothetical protein